MQAKKFLSAALSAVLIGSIASSAVSAVPAETPSPKTYNYVALGDSIAAGYGLEKVREIDPTNPISILAADKSGILSEELIADPVKGAYPAIFGNYLAELGENRGYETSTANLAAAAYSAYDIAQTIYDPDYLSPFGISVARMITGSSDPLKQYHTIFNKYLDTADLVSIQLGGNDIIRSVLKPLDNESNPILLGIHNAVMLTLFGCDAFTSVAAALYTITSADNAFTADNISEAFQVLLELDENTENITKMTAEDVSGVIDAVLSVNPDAKVALINMYNPYGNSLELEGKVRNLSTVLKSILIRAVKEVYGSEVVVDDSDSGAVSLKDIASFVDLSEFKLLSRIIEKLQSNKDGIIAKITAPIINAYKQRMSKLLPIILDEISYTVEYVFVGKNIAPRIKSLNDKLEDIAEEKDAIYVDVYGISNEDNVDPHPTAEGHKEIAGILWNTVRDTVTESMVVDELMNNSALTADRIKVGSTVKARAAAEGGTGKYQYAFYYRKVKNGSWTRVQDFSEKAVCTIRPSIAAKYEVRVDVRDSAGTVVSKTLSLTVTSK